MKKYITLAALLAAGTACANAAENAVTIEPLKDADWTHISLRNRATWTQDVTNGTLTLDNSNWGQAVSTYDISSDAPLYDFSVDITRGNVNAGISFVLIGSNCAIVVGTKEYTSGEIFYGTTDNTTAESYYLNAAWDKGITLNSSSLLASGLNYNAKATISGTTSVNAEGNTILSLSVESSATSDTGSATIDLGKDFKLDKVMICGDGANNSTGIWTVSNLTISVPEPSAFGLLAGVGALALVASRRRRR